MTLVEQERLSDILAEGPADTPEHPHPKIAPKNLIASIAAVMSEMAAATARGHNTFHQFKYPRIEDVVEILQPLMGKGGIVIFQDEHGKPWLEDHGNVICVRYQFTVAHSSGEVWPKPIFKTGAAVCRSQKTKSWDFSAIPKCSTSARKRFLMELFQLKVQDEDADADNQDYEPHTPPPQAPSLPERAVPHTITVKKGIKDAPTVWKNLFIEALTQAKSEAEFNEWHTLNESTVKLLNEKFPKLATEVSIAMGKILPALRKAADEPAIPDDPNFETGGPPDPP